MIDDMGGIITAAENKHIVVYVIDGVAYLSDNDSGAEFKLNADECRKLRNLLLKAERRVK